MGCRSSKPVTVPTHSKLPTDGSIFSTFRYLIFHDIEDYLLDADCAHGPDIEALLLLLVKCCEPYELLRRHDNRLREADRTGVLIHQHNNTLEILLENSIGFSSSHQMMSKKLFAQVIHSFLVDLQEFLANFFPKFIEFVLRGILSTSQTKHVKNLASFQFNFTLDFFYARLWQEAPKKIQASWNQLLSEQEFGSTRHSSLMHRSTSRSSEISVEIVKKNFMRIVTDVTKDISAFTEAARHYIVDPCTKYIQAQHGKKYGLCALENMGNSCYLNAVLIALGHTFFFRYAIVRSTIEQRGQSEKEYKNFPTAYVLNASASNNARIFYSELRETFKKMWSGITCAFQPTNFFSIVSTASDRRFRVGHQHDAHEFMIFVLDTVHEVLNQPVSSMYRELQDRPGIPEELVAEEWWSYHCNRNRSIVVDMFHGQLYSSVTCMQCGNATLAFDPFQFIAVPLHHTTLMECLQATFYDELLPDLFDCKPCGKPQHARQSQKIWRLPRRLLIHLKRFTSSGERINGSIKIPAALDLEPFCGKTAKYSLYSMIHHHGNEMNGHYTTTCKHPSDSKKGWMKYDDENVSSINIEDELNGSATAYILLYDGIDIMREKISDNVECAPSPSASTNR